MKEKRPRKRLTFSGLHTDMKLFLVRTLNRYNGWRIKGNAWRTLLFRDILKRFE